MAVRLDQQAHRLRGLSGRPHPPAGSEAELAGHGASRGMGRAGRALALSLLLLAAPAMAETRLRIGLAEDPDSFDPTPGISYVGRIVFMALCDKLLDADRKAEL